MQLLGDIVRRWLASAESDPTVLLGLTLEHLEEDRGGRVTAVTTAVITYTDEGRSYSVPIAGLAKWVLQDVPQSLARRMMAALSMPPSHAEELQRLGFDAVTLSVDDARLILAIDEALVTGGDVAFEAFERLGALATLRQQSRAARTLLTRCLDHPTRASAQARLQLAKLASQAGDAAGTYRLTAPALTRDADPRIVPRLRAMLLTVRAAFVAQTAQTCADITEAKRLADMAFAIAGRGDHLTTTYLMIHRRADSMGCKLT